METLEPKRAIFDLSNLPPPHLKMLQPDNFEHEQRMARLRAEYFEACPFIYQNTDCSRPDAPRNDLIDRVLAWQWSRGGKGLLLKGETGKGKTRLAWLLIRRLMLQDGIFCRAITDPSFAREYSRRLGNGSADEWMTSLSRVAVLFIDDFGKAAVTPRYKEQFYDILESRTNNGKPLILTTQLDRETLINRFGDEDGQAIVRRILEFTDIVNF